MQTTPFVLLISLPVFADLLATLFIADLLGAFLHSDNTSSLVKSFHTNPEYAIFVTTAL
jgi:hypothetical protein